ncbi:MAG: bifunctional NADH dehydrogenase FAD-containing subunit/selenide, water dikinase SelD, partial [Albidovulum sp.]|uniref:FAD-dependent oxidoreductase n=1 Tax=Albidovulum sp. TaxID=1872424 RepID=UPI0013209191
MQGQIPLTRDLVLIGGGHTHALVLRMWGMRPLPGVRLTLISPEPAAAYSGMLPGHVAGHYPREALQIDLVRLARHAGARLILGRAEGIDRAAGRIRVQGRPAVAYDVASIDIGITSDMPALTGFAANAVPAKPLDAFADAWEAFAGRAARGEAAPRVAVIGGGVAGVELALAAHHRLGPGAEVTVIEAD